jgi:choline dehydrogenase
VSISEAAAYDYVIVGGGSAGSVVASRLAAARPDATVLLIEAGSGGHGVAQIVDPPQWTKLSGTALDWGYRYAPAERVAGRSIPVPRGKVLGGCGGASRAPCGPPNRSGGRGRSRAGPPSSRSAR